MYICKHIQKNIREMFGDIPVEEVLVFSVRINVRVMLYSCMYVSRCACIRIYTKACTCAYVFIYIIYIYIYIYTYI